eukprot:5522380-Pyramimonas_sp.AAC.1
MRYGRRKEREAGGKERAFWENKSPTQRVGTRRPERHQGCSGENEKPTQEGRLRRRPRRPNRPPKSGPQETNIIPAALWA